MRAGREDAPSETPVAALPRRAVRRGWRSTEGAPRRHRPRHTRRTPHAAEAQSHLQGFRVGAQVLNPQKFARGGGGRGSTLCLCGVRYSLNADICAAGCGDGCAYQQAAHGRHIRHRTCMRPSRHRHRETNRSCRCHPCACWQRRRPAPPDKRARTGSGSSTAGVLLMLRSCPCLLTAAASRLRQPRRRWRCLRSSAASTLQCTRTLAPAAATPPQC